MDGEANNHQIKMRKRYDAVATVGKYRDAHGNEKKRYMTVGAVFEDDDGRLSLKLDGVPCSPDWSGWVSFYEPQDRQQGQPRQEQARRPEPPPAARQEAPAQGDDMEEIPF